MPYPRVTHWLVAAAIVLASGCAKQKSAVDRVGVNAVKKELFDGSWYFSRTVIDVDYEGGGLGTFPGDTAYDYQGSDLGSVPRIRWVIDEEALYAYRDYEFLEGGNGGDTEPGSLITHPVAAFEVEKHFDIQRAYNPATGEQQNVLEENDTDRRWYERDYMRVDWSENLLPGYFGQLADLYDVLGFFVRQDAGAFVQAESDFPDSWRPRFHTMSCDGLGDDSEDCNQDDQQWAGDYDKDQLYAFDFVTQDLMAPGDVADPFTGRTVPWCLSVYSDAPVCTTTATYIRNSFLRVSDKRQYEPVNWVDTRFERAGYFRLERPTYDRAEDPDDPGQGATDFLNYNINRHNIWQQWHDEDGNPIPHAERQVRPIVYYTTPELPAHLVEPSFQVTERWNELFMQMVRQQQGKAAAQYPDVACQDENPDGYCACVRDPDTQQVLNPTCPGQYDPFETPQQAADRGVVNPYDCHIEVPQDARPDLNRRDLSDEHFSGWFGAAQTGGECVVTLRMNACHKGNGRTPAEGEACQERGDSRFKFLSYVEQPGTGFLGIATLRGDPVSGEIMFGDANIGGPALDSYRTSALQMYDLINGDLTDEEFFDGEDVRTYLENLNRVQLPARPRTDFLPAIEAGSIPGTAKRTIDNKMAQFASRARDLAGPAGRANTYSDLKRELVGTPIERRMTENYETLFQAGIQTLPNGYGPADISDAILDAASPFRTDVKDRLDQNRRIENLMSEKNVMMPNEFVDASVASFVEQHKDWPRARVAIAVNQLLYFQTQVHELGHCLGLRHDFGGTADIHNFDDEYYQIKDQIALPEPADFDTDGTEGLSAAEKVRLEQAIEVAREKRELAGIDRYMSSSIMDYTSQWYERIHTQAGRYDLAAVAYGYGDMVELYDNQAGRALSDITPVNTPRVWAKYYHGGEVCEVDTDCAYNEGGERAGELVQTNLDAGLTQACVAHPSGASHGRICSNYDDDAAALGGSSRFVPVNYLFCTDDRVGTLGWCHRFDEGDNYRDIVRNVAEQYEREYIFTNFRRYRANFGIGAHLSRLIDRKFTILQSIFQNLLYRYQTDPEFRDDEGPFGFYDQFMATADVLNFYARVLGQPDVGSYQLDNVSGNFEKFSDTVGASGSQLDVDIGLGRHLFSTYQSGLTGITRVELIGSFYEKYIVMQMLTQRGWETGYTRDVPYWTNFYDLFPVEMQQIFRGIIMDRPETIAPRLTCAGGSETVCEDPYLVYMDFYRGDCSTEETCLPDPVTETYADFEKIDGGNSIFLQYLAAAYALTDFPVFYDTSFHNQLFVCVEGTADCFDPKSDAVEGQDYVRYTSPRFGKTFIAWQVEPNVPAAEQRSIGFDMVQEAADNAFLTDVARRTSLGQDVHFLEAMKALALGYQIPTDPGQAEADFRDFDRRQESLESFLFQLIELERELGIASYLRF